MNLKSTCLFQHTNQICNSRSTDNGIIHKNNPFAFYNCLQYTQLQMNTGFSFFLGWFDKSSANIGILIKCKSERNAGFLRESLCSRKSGFRNTGDKICFHRIRFCKGFSTTNTCIIDLHTIHGTVQSCKIDIFKNTMCTGFYHIRKSHV